MLRPSIAVCFFVCLCSALVSPFGFSVDGLKVQSAPPLVSSVQFDFNPNPLPVDDSVFAASFIDGMNVSWNPDGTFTASHEFTVDQFDLGLAPIIPDTSPVLPSVVASASMSDGCPDDSFICLGYTTPSATTWQMFWSGAPVYSEFLDGNGNPVCIGLNMRLDYVQLTITQRLLSVVWSLGSELGYCVSTTQICDAEYKVELSSLAGTTHPAGYEKFCSGDCTAANAQACASSTSWAQDGIDYVLFVLSAHLDQLELCETCGYFETDGYYYDNDGDGIDFKYSLEATYLPQSNDSDCVYCLF